MRKLQNTPNVSRTQRGILRKYFNVPESGKGSRPVWGTLRAEYNKQIGLLQDRDRYYSRTLTGQRELQERKQKRLDIFKKLLREKVSQRRENRRFIHTLTYDAYRREQRGTSVYLSYLGAMNISFQSRTRHQLTPFNYTETDLWFEYRHRNQNPTIRAEEGGIERYFDLPNVILNAIDQIGGSDGRVGAFIRIDIVEVPRTDVRLERMPMFREVIQSATPEFRGFIDTGSMMCVPETIRYHLERWDRKNKQYSIEEICNILNSEKESNEGYDTFDLVSALDYLRCPYKLLDVEEKVFIQDLKKENKNRNLPVFVGQVWNNHLYYCSDEDYIKSLASNDSYKISEKQIVLKKKEKEFDGIVLPVDDLKDIFLQQFVEDKKFRKVNLYNNRIVGYQLDNKKWIYANPDLEIVKEVCKNLNIPFKNQSLTFLGKSIFDKLYPVHKSSHFNDNVFSQLQVNAGIVSIFDNTTGGKQTSIDINKCRTACLMENRLGDYPVFNIGDDITEYTGGDLRFGWYYVETDNTLPMRGNGWYSNNFLEYCKGEKIKYNVKYQLLASGKIPSSYGISIVEKIMEASPENYKILVNTLIGYFGKLIGKYTSGYLETDFKFACRKFWDSDNVGTIYDLQDAVDVSNRKRLRIDKFKCVDIGEMHYGENEKIYMVQQTNASKEYVNDLPIYNKVLENEWIRCYELRKKLGGVLIKIKTDNVIVENATGKIELSNTIGGYKDETIKEDYIPLDIQHFTPKELPSLKTYETTREWKKINVEIGDADNYFEKLKPKLPNTSFCLTGLAGYGKSECVKGTDWYNDETTLKVAFTNKATESMSGITICQAFGIDFKTGLASKSKLQKCKNVKRIINDECFMTPSYAMGVFDLIHQKYPEIQFIFVGDPHQTRPVGEEHINWMETSVFHNLCGGNLIELIENQRNDLTTEYFDLINGKGIDITKFGKHKKSEVNICRTNDFRRQINEYYMKQNGVFIKWNKDKHNANGQDVYLRKDMPVMCVITNKPKGLINSKLFKIESIDDYQESFPECLERLGDDGKIVIEGQSFSYTEFMLYFVVAYAFTNHKVQSITLKERFVIHEWDKMTPREQYTAFSRTSSRDLVRIYN